MENVTVTVGGGRQSVLLSDVPLPDGVLSWDALVETLADMVMDPGTSPPYSIGIHAPLGIGTQAVLHQLRYRLQPGNQDSHELVPLQTGRRRPERKVRTRLTRGWIWRASQRSTDDPLPYSLRPGTHTHGSTAFTVRLNPSTYETVDQLWAGLGNEILQEVTGRIPPEQRERLWFDLNRRRLDPALLRRRVVASLVPRSLTSIAIAAVALFTLVVGVVTLTTILARTVDFNALLGPAAILVLAVAGYLGKALTASAGPLSSWLFANDPALQSGLAPWWTDTGEPLKEKAGRVQLFLQHDIDKVLRLASEHSRVVIFIVDLDRCSPHLVSGTFDMMNAFFSGSLPPTTFVLGYDPTMVAASLETTHESLNRQAREDPLTLGHLRHVGWQTIEALIDVPVRVPAFRGHQVTAYLEALLASDADINQRSAPVEVPKVPKQKAPAPQQEDPPAETDAIFAVPTVIQLDRLPKVRAALQVAADSLDVPSPRRIKALVNVWRFYAILEHRQDRLPEGAGELEDHAAEIARFAELTLNLPWLLDKLAVSSEIRTEFWTLLEPADDWEHAARSIGLYPEEHRVTRLRELIFRTGCDNDRLKSILLRYL